MLFRSSRLQLVPSSGFLGFTSASFQGKRPWKFENFFRPFLRIHRTTPTSVSSEPDLCTLTNEGIRLRVLFHSPDTLRIVIDADREEALFLGPAGEHENFGGVLEQEFLIYSGFTRYQSAEGSDVIAKANGSAAVFHSPENEMVFLGSGYRVQLHKGSNHFALAAGYEEELPELKKRAAQARSTDPEVLIQANAAEWDQIFTAETGAPEPRYRRKYRQAIWTIEASTFAPEGNFSRPYLGACTTAYTNGMWLWDTCFAVRGYARFNPGKCKEWLLSFVDHQQADGMLPGDVKPFSIGSQTQVPIFAWAANAIFAVDHDLDFLRTACRAAKKNNDWWMTLGDSRCGGLPATNPISYDNSPLYDPIRIAGMISSDQLVIPDIIAALVNDCEEIGKMARLLDDPSLEKEMKERRAFLCDAAHRFLYDPADAFYYSCQGDRRVKIKTGPALTAIVFAPEAVARTLVDTYLHQGSPAWPVHGIATVLADQPSYDPGNFWRGPIWGSTNRLMIDALERRGFAPEAAALREETLSLLGDADDFREVFHPETGRGSRGTLMSGFGAGVFLDLTAPPI